MNLHSGLVDDVLVGTLIRAVGLKRIVKGVRSSTRNLLWVCMGVLYAHHK